MQTVFIYNGDFTFKEVAVLEENSLLPENGTLNPLPQPNYKPVFDAESGEWIETATAEEIANWGVIETSGMSLEQRVELQEQAIVELTMYMSMMTQ